MEKYHIKYFFPSILIISSLFSCSSHKSEEDHDDDDHNHSGIVLSPEKASEFGIEVEEVSPTPFYDVIKTSGKIETSTSDIYTVTARQSGILTLNPDINLATHVSSGEKLGSITAEGLQGGDVNKAALANLEAAKAEFERLKPLHEEKLVTTSAFREVERNYKEAQALAGINSKGGSSVISSPATGIIQNIMVSSGQYVEAGTPIAVISKNINMTLRADLPARMSQHFGEIVSANFIPEGRENIISINELNGKRISGSSSAVENGYIPIYFTFAADPVTCPGGYAEVFLLCSEKKDVISIPRNSLIEIQGNKYVFVRLDDDEYEKRLVRTGASDGFRVEITEGLNSGENVVVKGASIIRMAEVSSIAPPAHNHNH